MSEKKSHQTSRKTRHAEEKKWTVAAQKGDRDAFNRLVKLHQRAVYRWAYRMVHSHDVADDLAQETFIRLHRVLERIDPERPLSPWLCRVVINLATNHLRRQKTSVSLSENPGMEALISSDNRADYPSAIHRRKVFLGKLEEAINDLPAKFKSVFVLRVQEHRSYEEIAEALELTLGTVMSRLSRARGRLRTALAEEIEKIRE